MKKKIRLQQVNHRSRGSWSLDPPFRVSVDVITAVLCLTRWKFTFWHCIKVSQASVGNEMDQSNWQHCQWTFSVWFLFASKERFFHWLLCKREVHLWNDDCWYVCRFRKKESDSELKFLEIWLLFYLKHETTMQRMIQTNMLGLFCTVTLPWKVHLWKEGHLRQIKTEQVWRQILRIMMSPEVPCW